MKEIDKQILVYGSLCFCIENMSFGDNDWDTKVYLRAQKKQIEKLLMEIPKEVFRKGQENIFDLL